MCAAVSDLWSVQLSETVVVICSNVLQMFNKSNLPIQTTYTVNQSHDSILQMTCIVIFSPPHNYAIEEHSYITIQNLAPSYSESVTQARTLAEALDASLDAWGGGGSMAHDLLHGYS
jgi:hypothetical protein